MQPFVRTELFYEFVVFFVGANPEPHNSLRRINPHGTVVRADTDRSETADLLKMEGRMMRIFFEELKTIVRKFLDMVREAVITFPKSWIGLMVHSSVHRPRSRSSRA